MILNKQFITIGILVLLSSCSSSSIDVSDLEIPADSTSNKPNILLIIADDMGLDATPNFSEGTIKPNMPNLQALINTVLPLEMFGLTPFVHQQERLF